MGRWLASHRLWCWTATGLASLPQTFATIQLRAQHQDALALALFCSGVVCSLLAYVIGLERGKKA